MNVNNMKVGEVLCEWPGYFDGHSVTFRLMMSKDGACVQTLTTYGWLYGCDGKIVLSLKPPALQTIARAVYAEEIAALGKLVDKWNGIERDTNIMGDVLSSPLDDCADELDAIIKEMQ